MTRGLLYPSCDISFTNTQQLITKMIPALFFLHLKNENVCWKMTTSQFYFWNT